MRAHALCSAVPGPALAQLGRDRAGRARDRREVRQDLRERADDRRDLRDDRRGLREAREGLHPYTEAVYLQIMDRRNLSGSARQLLEFKPWMLALAVFLALALGVAVMEQVREARSMWAQATPQDAPSSR